MNLINVHWTLDTRSLTLEDGFWLQLQEKLSIPIVHASLRSVLVLFFSSFLTTYALLLCYLVSMPFFFTFLSCFWFQLTCLRFTWEKYRTFRVVLTFLLHTNYRYFPRRLDCFIFHCLQNTCSFKWLQKCMYRQRCTLMYVHELTKCNSSIHQSALILKAQIKLPI